MSAPCPSLSLLWPLGLISAPELCLFPASKGFYIPAGYSRSQAIPGLQLLWTVFTQFRPSLIILPFGRSQLRRSIRAASYHTRAWRPSSVLDPFPRFRVATGQLALSFWYARSTGSEQRLRKLTFTCAPEIFVPYVFGVLDPQAILSSAGNVIDIFHSQWTDYMELCPLDMSL